MTFQQKDEKNGGKFFGKKKFFNKKRDDKENKRKDRIAKRLAILGVASRRDAGELVKNGKVKINGVECKDLSYLVSYEDTISVNGKEIANKPIKTQIYIFNKPAGYVTTNNDPQGRKTIFELIPSKFGRLMSIGRLDMNTEGLLLLTNNGEVARLLEMPATQLKRIYFARVIGEMNEEVEKKLADLRNGINIEGTHYGKIIVEKQPSNGKPYNVLKIIIFEGKNNEIRRVMWHLGLRVVKLTRVQYGDFRLNGLPSGCIQESRTPLHIRDLERRASANIKAYNKKHNIVKSNQEDGVKTKLEEQPTDVSGDKLQKINEDTQEDDVKTDME
ncbi:MAG: rRNA pseudouridine synthase [Rickettsiales bacterium]|nr:rRNA pseudouridine synthase [Rickettsiales bacterium]